MDLYVTVASCVDDGCRCNDRSGIVLYKGESRQEAEAAAADAPHGYNVVIEEREPSAPGGY